MSSTLAVLRAYIAGMKVCGDRRWSSVENGHTSGALDPIVPLIGIRMPMHISHAARLNRHARRSNRFRDKEVGAIRDPDCSTLRLGACSHIAKPEHERIWWLACGRRHLRCDQAITVISRGGTSRA